MSNILIKKRKPPKYEPQKRGVTQTKDKHTERWICGNCGNFLINHVNPIEDGIIEINSIKCDQCGYWSVFITTVEKKFKGKVTSTVPYHYNYVDLGKKK